MTEEGRQGKARRGFDTEITERTDSLLPPQPNAYES